MSENEWVKALEELKKKYDELFKPKEHGWWYDEKTKCLIFQIEKDNFYDIPVDELKNPKKLVDWIFHIFHKSFIKEKDMYEFLEAVDLLLFYRYW